MSLLIMVSCRDGDELRSRKKDFLQSHPQVDSLLLFARDSLDAYPDSALAVYGRAAQIARENRYFRGTGEAGYKMGLILRDDGEYLESNKLLTQSLEDFERSGDRKNVARVYNGLGIVHEKFKNLEKALDYYSRSLAIYRELGEKLQTGQLYNNIGAILLNNKRLDEADSVLTLAVAILGGLQDSSELVSPYINLGEICEAREDTTGALNYYSAGFRIASSGGASWTLMKAMYSLGKLSGETGRLDQARVLLTEAYDMSSLYGSTSDRRDICRELHKIVAAAGDTLKAYSLLAESVALQDQDKLEEAKTELLREDFEKKEKSSAVMVKNRTIQAYVTLAGLLVAVLLILGIFRTYQANRRSNRLLREMDELKSRLFSDLTHEFRTPLTLILAPLEEMLSAGTKKNPSRSELKMMQRNAGHLLNLVNQMLDLAKLDAKSLKLDLTENDFVDFFKVRVLSFSSLASSKGIKFSYSVPGKPLNTLFDADKLEKIINNLLSNAIKFTAPGGEVKCVLEIVDKDKEMIRFYVEDTGTGISAGELGKIFDRYYQVEGSMRSGTFGTGIGLSLTRELVRLMHGEIRAESQPGCGSRFTVTLQLGKTHLDPDEYTILKTIMPPSARNEIAPEAVKKLPGKSDTVSERKGGSSDLPVVLIVEDQEDIRNYLAVHIGDNFRVLEAENGVLGLSAAIQHIPDLVITDLIMPGMDGLEMCGKLKEDEHTSHIPVIMLTAKTDLPDRMAGIGTGADAYLTKPFHIQEVLLVISKLIEQRKKLRERFSTNIKLEPRDIAITSADEKFLSRALAVIEDHLGDSTFDVNIFQKEMAMSRMQLFRKIKALTDQAPGDFIRIIRLKRAARLIEEGFGNIAQITYEVGFNNPSHFARSFKDLYGILPSDYAKKTHPGKPK